MCQFCHQHGEGRKWYLKAENYSADLLSDIRRRRYIDEFIRSIGNGTASELERTFHRAMRLPAWLRHLGYKYHERRYRKDHFGQVVPIEDLRLVFAISNSVVRMPCLCRKNTTGRSDAAYCFGLGIDPEKLLDIKEAFLETFRPGPDATLFERMSADEALELHRSFEAQGLIHTVWTFKTPFIGAICNCDRRDCLAMVSHRYGFQLFFRAEYVASIDKDACVGCRACLRMCQFGAIGFSVLDRKAEIDPLRCYGCGVCREACEAGAIRLDARSEHPLARNLW